MKRTRRNFILDILMKIVFIAVCIFLLFYCKHSIEIGEIERTRSSTMGMLAIVACIVFQTIDLINICKDRKVYEESNKVA